MHPWGTEFINAQTLPSRHALKIVAFVETHCALVIGNDMQIYLIKVRQQSNQKGQICATNIHVLVAHRKLEKLLS